MSAQSSLSEEGAFGAETWVVLHLPCDDSHVLVDLDSITFIPPLLIGESVNTRLQGYKRDFEGVVKAFSRDYDKMKDLQDLLNSSDKPSREPSFHADRPRRCKVKCIEKLRTAPPATKGSKKRNVATISSGSSDEDEDMLVSKFQGRVSDVDDSLSASSTDSEAPQVHSTPVSPPSKRRKVTKDTSGHHEGSSQQPPSPTLQQSRETEDDAWMMPQNENTLPLSPDPGRFQVNSPVYQMLDNVEAVYSNHSRKSSTSCLRLPMKDSNHNDTVHDIQSASGSVPYSANSHNRTQVRNDSCSRQLTKDSNHHDTVHDIQSVSRSLPYSGNSHNRTHVRNDSASCSRQLTKDSNHHDSLHDFRSASGSVLNSGISHNRTPVRNDSTSCSRQLAKDSNHHDSVHDAASGSVLHASHCTSESPRNGSTSSSRRPPMGDHLDNDNPPASPNGFVTEKWLLQPIRTRVGGSLAMTNKKMKSIIYSGPHLLYHDSDDNVERLVNDYPIYIKKTDLKEAKKCKSASSLARNMCLYIFTPTARLACSVSGKPAPNKNGIVVKRTPLNKDGVAAIVSFIMTRSERKKWHTNELAIKQAMGNYLAEDRLRQKLLDELQATE